MDASTVYALREWLAACPVSLDDFAELMVDQPMRGTLLGVVRVCEQGGATLAAVRAQSIGLLHHNRPTELREDPTPVDLQLATRWAPSTVKTALVESGTLITRFPDTLEALYAGRITHEQARAVVDLTSTLEDSDAARAIEAQILPLMPGQAVSETRRALRGAVEALDAETGDKRHAAAREQRRVEFRAERDGMACLSIHAPAPEAKAAYTALTKRVRKRATGDTRTLDQRRSDDAIATLTHAPTPGTAITGKAERKRGSGAQIHVVVNIKTLLGEDNAPGELSGYGPICAEQTRRIAEAEDSAVRFLLTSSEGTLVAASAHTYRLPAALDRFAKLRDRTCTFPMCAMPSDRCDIDHLIAWDKGGSTALSNLGPVCRTHHTFKGMGYYQVERVGDTVIWTDPHKNFYITAPANYAPAINPISTTAAPP